MADLVIIGNGFDLAAEMKTSYSDFFEALSSINEAGQLYRDITDISFRKPDELLPKFRKYPMISFWEILFDTLKLPSIKDWNNVEKIIGDTLNAVNPSLWRSKSGDGYAFVKQFLDKFHVTYRNDLLRFYCLPYMESTKNVYEFLFCELNKFEKKFAVYIKEQEGKATDETFQRIRSLFFKILEKDQQLSAFSPHDISILSFNYTSCIADTDRLGIQLSDSIVPIHGKARDDENIIFGIDEENIDPKSDIYAFTKTSRIINSLHATSNKNPQIFDKSITKVRFYGHSLSKFDYSYFQSIFDHLNIYQNWIELRFYFTKYLPDIGKEIQDQQTAAVINLIKYYGGTLDNKRHGDNMLHKLLLEGRLKIIEIPRNEDVILGT